MNIKSLQVLDYIQEFFGSNPKQLIDNPDELIYLTNDLAISRKALKHIVHSREFDYYSERKIHTMIKRCIETVNNPEYILPNHNKKYPNSKISIRLYQNDGALLVVHDNINNIELIINSFYRRVSKFEKMLNKSKQ
jgi:hypothetical protein